MVMALERKTGSPATWMRLLLVAAGLAVVWAATEYAGGALWWLLILCTGVLWYLAVRGARRRRPVARD